MKIIDVQTKEFYDMDEDLAVYVWRRNLESNLPKPEDFDRMKLKEAKSDEVVRTSINGNFYLVV